jgi:hypothetical protein
VCVTLTNIKVAREFIDALVLYRERGIGGIMPTALC